MARQSGRGRGRGAKGGRGGRTAPKAAPKAKAAPAAPPAAPAAPAAADAAPAAQLAAASSSSDSYGSEFSSVKSGEGGERLPETVGPPLSGPCACGYTQAMFAALPAHMWPAVVVVDENVCRAAQRAVAAHPMGVRPLPPSSPAAATSEHAADSTESATFALGEPLARAAGSPLKIKHLVALIRSESADLRAAVGLKRKASGSDVSPFGRLRVTGRLMQLLHVRLTSWMASTLANPATAKLKRPFHLSDVIHGASSTPLSTAEFASLATTIGARSAGLAALAPQWELAQKDAAAASSALHVRVSPGSSAFEDWVTHIRREDVDSQVDFLNGLLRADAPTRYSASAITVRSDVSASTAMVLAGFPFATGQLDDLPALWFAVEGHDAARRITLAKTRKEDTEEYKEKRREAAKDARARLTAGAASPSAKAAATTSRAGSSARDTSSGPATTTLRNSSDTGAIRTRFMALAATARPNWVLTRLGLCNHCREDGHEAAACPVTSSPAVAYINEGVPPDNPPSSGGRSGSRRGRRGR